MHCHWKIENIRISHGNSNVSMAYSQKQHLINLFYNFNKQEYFQAEDLFISQQPTYVLDLPMTLKKNFMAPFYGWGSTASRLEPLRGVSSLLFTTKFPEIPGAHFIDLGRMKC